MDRRKDEDIYLSDSFVVTFHLENYVSFILYFIIIQLILKK